VPTVAAQDTPLPEQGLIGLVGGMSWESTALYYARLNRLVHRRLGGHHNARSVLVTLDFEDLTSPAGRGDWAGVAATVSAAAAATEKAGAGFVMLTAMTGHAVADEVASAIGIPLLHAGDVLAETAAGRGVTRLGLLGTSTTLTGTFLTSRLKARGIEPAIPGEADRATIDRIIFDELTQGVIEQSSRKTVTTIATSLKKTGAEAVVLACTELPLLFAPPSLTCPFIDLVDLHVEAAVDWSLNGIPAGASTKSD
jgi:aspartate racemase